MIGQLRVEHALDGGVAGEQVDDRACVLAVAVHPHAERLHAAQHEVAVERRRHRAGRVLREAQALGELVVVDGEEPADHVAVTAEVLRGRVHDDVGAERDRLLQVRRGERVVDDDQGAAAMGELGDRLDVDAREQRVGRRLEPHHAGVVGPVVGERVEVGEVDRRPREAERCPHLVDQAERAAVRVVAEQDPLALTQEAQDVVLGGEATGERQPVARLFERGEAQPRARGGWGCPTREYSKPLVDADLVLGERRRQRDRYDDRATGLGSGAWPACTARVSNAQPDCSSTSPTIDSLAGYRLEVRQQVGAGEHAQRPPARQHEQGRRACRASRTPSRAPGRRRSSAASDPSPSRPRCPSPTDRGRSPPSASSSSTDPEISAAANGGVFLQTGNWLTPLARIRSIATRTVSLGLT